MLAAAGLGGRRGRHVTASCWRCRRRRSTASRTSRRPASRRTSAWPVAYRPRCRVPVGAVVLALLVPGDPRRRPRPGASLPASATASAPRSSTAGCPAAGWAWSPRSRRRRGRDPGAVGAVARRAAHRRRLARHGRRPAGGSGWSSGRIRPRTPPAARRPARRGPRRARLRRALRRARAGARGGRATGRWRRPWSAAVHQSRWRCSRSAVTRCPRRRAVVGLVSGRSARGGGRLPAGHPPGPAHRRGGADLALPRLHRAARGGGAQGARPPGQAVGLALCGVAVALVAAG